MGAFAGKTAVVTGASSGIGQAVALRLARSFVAETLWLCSLAAGHGEYRHEDE